MRQWRVSLLLGAVLALCVGSVFAADVQALGEKWEQGYGYSSSLGDVANQLAMVAEAPRLRTQEAVVASTLLSKRVSPTMLAVGGHFEHMEVAAAPVQYRTGKATSA
jgi:hypothetical protein